MGFSRVKLSGLYVITDERLTPYEGGKIFELVERALKGGARLVQLRDKTSSDTELWELSLELKKLCHRYGALFIINDRVYLAKEVDADGVHLGKDDETLEEALKKLSGKIIGVSCYGSLERAKWAEKLGASYVAFGSFFPSPTKPEAEIAPLEILALAKREVKIPVCAIGGITLERAEEVIKACADLVAVISDIWLAEDVEKRALGYTQLFRKYGKL